MNITLPLSTDPLNECAILDGTGRTVALFETTDDHDGASIIAFMNETREHEKQGQRLAFERYLTFSLFMGKLDEDHIKAWRGHEMPFFTLCVEAMERAGKDGSGAWIDTDERILGLRG